MNAKIYNVITNTIMKYWYLTIIFAKLFQKISIIYQKKKLTPML